MIRVLIIALLALFAAGCTAATKQIAACVATKAATRCLPQCACCVRDVIKECKGQAATELDGAACPAK